MTTELPPELVKKTGTLTVEDIDVVAATGNAALQDFVSDLAADTSLIFQSTFTGEDDGAAATIYAATQVKIIDNTEATEDGSYTIQTMQAGSLTDNLVLALGMAMNGATGGDQGAGTINAKGLFVDGVAVTVGGGDVFGPGSVTDTAIAVYDDATGKLLTSTSVLIDASNNITGVNDLTVDGDLVVNGDVVTVNAATLSVEDPLIQLAKANNTTDTLDIGFVGLYDTSGSLDLYAGIFRDATDNKFHAFVDSQEDLSTSATVNKGATGYTVATLVANIEGDVTGTVSSLSNHDTDALSEGATNKYASTANVDSAGAVMETDFNAQTVLVAVADNTPLPITMGASTMLARLASGDIIAATTTEIRTLLNVADGANVNLVKATTEYDGVGDADFTPGTTTVLTMPKASPGNLKANVQVTFHGLGQQEGEWGISGTTITFNSAIPLGVVDVQITVLG